MDSHERTDYHRQKGITSRQKQSLENKHGQKDEHIAMGGQMDGWTQTQSHGTTNEQPKMKDYRKFQNIN